MSDAIPFFNTHIAPESIERVTQVLRSTFLNEGEAVREFEQKVGTYVGTRQTLAANSCTSALHLALAAVGVKQGDEVIVPPQTFIATAMAVLYLKATPVFADIDPLTGNMNPKTVAEKITPRTKALLPVHWGGSPCEMKELRKIADDHNIPLIDDAAHAFGAEYDEQMIGSPEGSKSRITCFSFQAIKGLTTGDGGMLCCSEKSDFDQLVKLHWFGIDKSKTKANDIGERISLIDLMGYKYNMNNVSAAIGLGNLIDFPARLQKRREIDALYRKKFAKVPGITLLKVADGAKSSCWIFTMRIERREDFARAMKERAIPVSVVDRRIDKHPVFGEGVRDLPGMAVFDADQIAVPLHEGLSEEQVSRIIEAVTKGW